MYVFRQDIFPNSTQLTKLKTNLNVREVDIRLVKLTVEKYRELWNLYILRKNHLLSKLSVD